LASLAFARAELSEANTTLESKEMMAMTTRSSMRVKPPLDFFSVKMPAMFLEIMD
jgi:hypothetical protein